MKWIRWQNFLEERYESYKSGIGLEIMNGNIGFEELDDWICNHEISTLKSGRQEMLENIINSYII